MIKMIVTDLDNTLLHSDKTISDYTVEVLMRCRKKGFKVIFATARSAQAASKFIERFTPDVFIGYGGALISNKEEIIRRFDIPANTAYDLILKCLNTPEISSIYAINETAALTNDKEFASQEETSHYKYTDFLTGIKSRYLKISVISRSQSAVEKIASQFPMCDMLRYTGENLYRFANKEAVKWNAVKALSKHFGIHAGDILAFGDDLNDLEMIRECGIGVAVMNAVPEVKSAANYICAANDDDGVAQWIENHIL